MTDRTHPDSGRIITSGDVINDLHDHIAELETQLASERLRAPNVLGYAEAMQVCAEAYQVVGILLKDLGIFDTERATKLLDNLAIGRMIHKDVLPWQSLGPAIASQSPDRLGAAALKAGIAAAPKAPRPDSLTQLVQMSEDAGLYREDFAPQQAAPAVPHPDDAAVDRFAAALKTKLAHARAKGRSGWDSAECTQQRLSGMLREHVEKGDPRDVANFCMFLWCRGEAIAAPQQEVQAVDDLAKELDTVREALQWYMRRYDHLQRVRHRMRDPERTMVCDILANGSLLVPEGQRYTVQPAPSGDASHVQKPAENEHVAGDVSKKSPKLNTTGDWDAARKESNKP